MLYTITLFLFPILTQGLETATETQTVLEEDGTAHGEITTDTIVAETEGGSGTDTTTETGEVQEITTGEVQETVRQPSILTGSFLLYYWVYSTLTTNVFNFLCPSTTSSRDTAF